MEKYVIVGRKRGKKYKIKVETKKGKQEAGNHLK